MTEAIVVFLISITINQDTTATQSLAHLGTYPSALACETAAQQVRKVIEQNSELYDTVFLCLDQADGFPIQ